MASGPVASVRAKQMMTSARLAFEMKCFIPLMTHPPSTRVADVCMPAPGPS